MINQKKKIISVILLLCLILSGFAGCKGKDVVSDRSESFTENVEEDTESVADNTSQTDSGIGTSSQNSGKTPSQNSSKTPSQQNVSNDNGLKGTTVKYATWDDVDKTEYGPVIKKFTRETGINIKIVTASQADYITKLTGLIASGNAPDVYIENNEWPRTVGIAQPITNAGINPNEKRWDPLTTNMSTVNGKTYLVSSNQSMFSIRIVLYYNKKIFAENGINTPDVYVKNNQWTWDTLSALASQIKAATGAEAGFGGDPRHFINAYGGSFFKYKNGKFYNTLGETALTEGWKYYLENKKAGVFKTDRNGFDTGKLAMCISDTYGLKSIGYWKHMPVEDVGVTYLPKKSASDTVYPSAGYVVGYGLCKGAKNPEGAGEFLKYFLDMNNYDINSVYRCDEYIKFAEKISNIPIAAESHFVLQGPRKIVEIPLNIYNADPSQVTVELNKINNVVNNSISRANQILAHAN